MKQGPWVADGAGVLLQLDDVPAAASILNVVGGWFLAGGVIAAIAGRKTGSPPLSDCLLNRGPYW